MTYSLANILTVAKQHPFYNKNVLYPPQADHIKTLVQQTTNAAIPDPETELKTWPLLHKATLYSTIQRLINDTSPENTYRHAVYASITGGGNTGGTPLFFATDVHENRRQRAEYGRLLALTGVIERGDWVVSMHTSGELYRALDLITETIENAGGCCLAAGAHMSPAQVTSLLSLYRANVIAGDSSQVVGLATHIARLPASERDALALRVTKVLYTSEVLTAAQRRHLRAVFGPRVILCSALASAEAGPWAVGSPRLTGGASDTAEADFVFDTRIMRVDIFSRDLVSLEETEREGQHPPPSPLSEGETGLLALTPLCRLRNPLIRYLCGDIGSVRRLTDDAAAAVPENDRPHLRVLRLRGRDARSSFNWEGEYIDLANLAAIVETPSYGVLHWQVVVDCAPPDDDTAAADVDGTTTLRPRLTVRVLQSLGADDDVEVVAARQRDMVQRIKTLIVLQPLHEKRFSVEFHNSLDGFERSKTGRKVIRFINRFYI